MSYPEFPTPYHTKPVMSPVARIGDQWVGLCVCHPIPIPMSGIIITGSPNVLTNTIPTARKFDLTLGW
jgi:uncharacterized Zn-binding protein involved in type VI secretion